MSGPFGSGSVQGVLEVPGLPGVDVNGCNSGEEAMMTLQGNMNVMINNNLSISRACQEILAENVSLRPENTNLAYFKNQERFTVC